jgi:hypothetical protein
MKNAEYLMAVLDSQALAEDSSELKALRSHRETIEECLREAFGSAPVIRYGGSQAKGTLIKESYDLDIVCYFPRDEEDAGDTLEQIYNNVKDVLSKDYFVEPRTSALRVKGLDKVDFHIDVVPGRFVEEGSYDAFLYCSSGDRCRLKTNIETHIKHVKGSGVTDAIKLMKVWRTRNGVQLKTFVLELIVIDTLAGTDLNLEGQVKTVLEKLRDESDSISVQDPANSGNDLSELWNDGIKASVAARAKSTLALVKSSGWESVFGKLPEKAQDNVVEALQHAARSSSAPTRPWCE